MHTTLGDTLWRLHTGLTQEGINQLVDLAGIPMKMREIERKYIFSVHQQRIDEAMSDLFSRIGGMVMGNKMSIDSLTVFVGIDQYYIFSDDKTKFDFRYRSGANRPPQLSVKYQMAKGSNLMRGEINLGVEQTDPDKVRAFMSAISAISGLTPKMFSIQQSGIIWEIADGNQKVEVVAYRVKRFAPGKLEGAFIEIEPLDSSSPEESIEAIEKYQKILGLGDMICKQSISEMFCPGNEGMFE